MHKKPRVLLLLKYREDPWGDYGDYHCGHLSSGLYNSANFVREMLEKLGIEAKLAHCIDGNSIDKEIYHYKPTHVILEAFWMPPYKFDDILPLHKKVKFIIRNHSEIPFLANEGVAIEWFFKYITYPNVFFSNNSPRAQREIIAMARIAHPEWEEEDLREKFIYLPNYYPNHFKSSHIANNPHDEIHIGCFGSIRPLKNQLLQAMAALEYAQSLGKKLVFHINGSRIEEKGDRILKNIRNLFLAVVDTGHRLKEHKWMDLKDFLKVIHKLDLGLQVSFSETFNIVTANFIEECVPIVVSNEIPFADKYLAADPTDSSDIVSKLARAHRLKLQDPGFNPHAKELSKYSHRSKKIWAKYFNIDIDC